MRILRFSYLTNSFTVLLATLAYTANGIANDFSVVNTTMNATHRIITTQHENELMTTTTTKDFIDQMVTDLDGKFVAQKTSYSNGTEKLKSPHNEGEIIGTITQYTEKGSGDVKITYADEDDYIYRVATLFENGTFQGILSNGVIITEETDGSRTTVDHEKTHVKYRNGTETTTTKTDPVTITIIHPDGTKITIFKKNGTIDLLHNPNNLVPNYINQRLN